MDPPNEIVWQFVKLQEVMSKLSAVFEIAPPE